MLLGLQVEGIFYVVDHNKYITFENVKYLYTILYNNILYYLPTLVICAYCLSVLMFPLLEGLET